MKKKINVISADEMHELILNMTDEYYKLFQLMFNHICAFLKAAETLVNEYKEENNCES